MNVPFSQTLYRELRVIAAGYLRREPRSPTLQPTALVHDAFIRLQASAHSAEVVDRAQFFSIAAAELRRILVEHARRRQAQKRGGGWRRITLSAAEPSQAENRIDVLALEGALQALVRTNAAWARVVELRYFGGMSEEEVAEALGVDARTVRRRWVAARAWLRRALGGTTVL